MISAADSAPANEKRGYGKFNQYKKKSIKSAM